MEIVCIQKVAVQDCRLKCDVRNGSQRTPLEHTTNSIKNANFQLVKLTNCELEKKTVKITNLFSTNFVTKMFREIYANIVNFH